MDVRRLVAVVVGLGLAGAAVAVAAGASSPPPPRLQIDSVGCVESGAFRSHGSCTYLLTDGRRFRCPLSFSHHRQTPSTLEHATACRPLAPIVIPHAWKRVFNRLYAVQACLSRRGIVTHGGPYVDGPRPRRKTPIGELVSFNTSPTAFIAFYTNASAARRAEPKVISNARRTHGEVQRHGLVTVVWTTPPARSLRARIDACAF